MGIVTWDDGNGRNGGKDAACIHFVLGEYHSPGLRWLQPTVQRK